MWVSGDGRGQILAKRRRRLSTVPEVLAAQEQELNMKVLSLGINFFCGFPRVYNEAYARTRKCVQRSDLCSTCISPQQNKLKRLQARALGYRLNK